MKLKNIKITLQNNQTTLSAKRYQPLSDMLSELLRRKNHSITLSPEYTNKSYGKTLSFTLKSNRFFLKDGFDKKHALGEQLARLNVDKITLSSGVKKEDLDKLFSKIFVSSAQKNLKNFKAENIEIVFKQADHQKKPVNLLPLKPISPPPLVKPKKIKTIPQKEIKAPVEKEERPDPSKMSAEELTKHGKRLSKTAFNAGLKSDLKEEILEWIKAAKKTVKPYLSTSIEHWPDDLLPRRYIYVDLTKRILNFQKRLLIRQDEFELAEVVSRKVASQPVKPKTPSPDNSSIFDLENISPPCPDRTLEEILNLDKNPFSGKSVYDLADKCRAASALFLSKKRLEDDEKKELKALENWLTDLVKDDNLKIEFPALKKADSTIIRNYREIFHDFLWNMERFSFLFAED